MIKQQESQAATSNGHGQDKPAAVAEGKRVLEVIKLHRSL